MVTNEQRQTGSSRTVRNRYGALLAALVITIFVFPFLTSHVKLVKWLFELVSIGLFATALHAVSRRRKILVIAVVLGVPMLIGSMISSSLAIEGAFSVGSAFRALFLAFLIVAVFSDIWRRDRITMDAIFGACTVYLLIALAGGAAYTALESLAPGSFDLSPSPASVGEAGERGTTMSELSYFSIVTMTTVGYGDIVPVSPSARALAALQGLVAQLYLAIIVARLVSLEITHRSHDSS
jgi:hypothetical protein